MSLVRVTHPNKKVRANIHLPSSKSISNRTLILQAVSNNKIVLNNISSADDTLIMQQSLQQKQGIVYVKNAGTCMRFLTAYFACSEGEVELHGEERMYKRPVHILVDSLRKLGADITYLNEEGFPPLRIKGKLIEGGQLTMDASVSSQFITALMLVAPQFNKGLTIKLTGEITSQSYIEMTVELMKNFGFNVSFHQNNIIVSPQLAGSPNRQISYSIEPDWSSASYWYEIAALSGECEIILNGLTAKSLQGDAIIAEYMKAFGVETTFTDEGTVLRKAIHHFITSPLHFDLASTPDLAPTMAVTAAAKNIKTELTGLQNLRIKESDRLHALETELSIYGFNVIAKKNTLLINQIPNLEFQTSNIRTYNDHRIAMAFAPLGLMEDISIEDPDVVIKSYPNFWEDLEQAGFKLNE